MSKQPADLTLAEARLACEALGAEIHPEFYMSAGLNLRDHFSAKKHLALMAYVYPTGLTKGESFCVYADTWRDLLQEVRDENAKREDLRRDHTIRSMALKIIELTADLGECTDRALRSEFPARDVQLYAKDAADKANELAAGGPFSVLLTDGANEAVPA